MLSKKFISMDLGTKNIKIVEGKFNKNKVYISKAAVLETPVNSVDNGSIADKVMLRSEIDNALGMNDIGKKETNFTTNSNSIINREIEVPYAEGEELDTVVNFEIQQYLPITMDDYITQYTVLEEIETNVEGEGEAENKLKKLRIFVVAYPKYIAEGYLNLARDLNLKPNALDVSFNSIHKLFSEDTTINDKEYNLEETCAFIDMGAESLRIDIVKEGNIDFSRMVTRGGNSINEEIKNHYKISDSDAEELKIKRCDFTLPEEEITLEDDPVTYIAKEQVDDWIREINRVLQYYKNKALGNTIDKIYIHGGTSRLKGIGGYMRKLVNVPVIKIKSIGNVYLNKNLDPEDLDLYLNALGTIIRL